jgi:hypothetical protein
MMLTEGDVEILVKAATRQGAENYSSCWSSREAATFGSERSLLGQLSRSAYVRNLVRTARSRD